MSESDWDLTSLWADGDVARRGLSPSGRRLSSHADDVIHRFDQRLDEVGVDCRRQLNLHTFLDACQSQSTSVTLS